MQLANQFQIAGMHISRYALVLLLFWMGGSELGVVEPGSVNRIVAAVPLLSPTYEFMDGRTVAEFLGFIEIVLAAMIAARPFLAEISATGSLFASVLFLVIGCVLCATPGWELTHNSPALYVARGQICLSDVVLLGVSLWIASEALFAAKMHCPSVRMAEAAR